MARKENNYKEVKIIRTSEIINVSADALWALVSQFDNIGQFLTGIDHAEGSGKPEFEGATCSERICYVNLKGYNRISEKLTMFNQAKRELAYEYKGGGPGFLLFAGNHWTVIPIGPNQSQLRMEATMRLKKLAGTLFGGKLRRTVEREIPISLNEIKLFAETGRVSASKKARLEVLARKKNKRAA